MGKKCTVFNHFHSFLDSTMGMMIIHSAYLLKNVLQEDIKQLYLSLLKNECN